MRVLLLIGTLLALQACDFGVPELRLEREGEAVEIHFETLRDYPTRISRLRLEDLKSGDVVWEVRGRSGPIALWDVALVEGENPVIPPGKTADSVQAVTPTGSQTFWLRSGTTYQLTVFSAKGRHKKSMSFQLQATELTPPL